MGDYLSTPEKAAVTSYFRHISESFLPTYTTIFIAVGLTNGAVSVSSFVLAMLAHGSRSVCDRLPGVPA